MSEGIEDYERVIREGQAKFAEEYPGLAALLDDEAAAWKAYLEWHHKRGEELRAEVARRAEPYEAAWRQVFAAAASEHPAAIQWRDPAGGMDALHLAEQVRAAMGAKNE